MAFEMLERTPQVAPLLVRLYDTHNLYNLAENKGDDQSCAELTTIMVDLLSIKLSDKESELITDVLLALMKQAQDDLKAALAERLAIMEAAPLRIILSMANEDVAIADPVLRQSPVLQDLDLMYILHSKGVEHGRSIAARKGLTPALINVLADTGDLGVAVNLSENDGIVLTDHAYGVFTDMAKEHEVLARPMLTRDDLPVDIAKQLYEFVGQELKTILRSRFDLNDDALDMIDDIVIDMVDAKPSLRDTFNDQLLSFARHQEKRGELKVPTMVSTLRRGQFAMFLAQFAVFCELPVTTVRAMIKQETGQALAIVCKAKDLTKGDFISLYLLTERLRFGERRVVNDRELTRLMMMFDEIVPEQARQLLKNSRH